MPNEQADVNIKTAKKSNGEERPRRTRRKAVETD